MPMFLTLVMVIISKLLLFNILKEHFWHTSLSKSNIVEYEKILERKLSLSFKSDEKCRNVLRAELFRLKANGLRCKIKGGVQFKRFHDHLAESKYSWDVEFNSQNCQLKLDSEMLKLTNTIHNIEKNVVNYVKIKEKEGRLLNKKVNSLENKLKQCHEKLKENVISRSNVRKRKLFENCTVTHQSKRRKNEKELFKSALSCVENSTCKPIAIIVDRNGRQEVLDLLDDENKENATLSETNKDLLNTLVYILDTFNISNKAYHELSMIFKNLPRSHVIHKFVTDLNAGFTILETPDGLGVQQSLKLKLNELALNLLSKDAQIFTDNKIRIKLSADGTMIGKRLHVVNVTFTILNESRCASAEGNYPLCIVRTKENYTDLCVALSDLRQEVESLHNKNFSVGGKKHTVAIYLGGDYKFLLLAVGLSHVSAEYSCIYCKCTKKERSDFSKEWSVTDPVHGARETYIVTKVTSQSKKQPKISNFSIVNIPIFPCIPPDMVVVDHLHLFLRITDKLFNLLISELRMLDNITAQSTFQKIDPEKLKHISSLENALVRSGIDFHLFINKETKKLEYRDLTGPEKIKFLCNFKAEELIDNKDRADLIQSLWDQFGVINSLIKSEYPVPSEIQPLIEKWCDSFVNVYQARDVTPYIHILRYHVTQLIKMHGNLVKFSQQGLEKLNDVITKVYFRSTNHKGNIALKQVMEKQNRKNITEKFERKPDRIITCSRCKMPDHNKKSCIS